MASRLNASAALLLLLLGNCSDRTRSRSTGSPDAGCRSDLDCQSPSLCACLATDCSVQPDFLIVHGKVTNTCISEQVRREVRIPIRTLDGGWRIEIDGLGRVFRTSDEARERIENEQTRNRNPW
jgi:hypothetical protein